MFLVKQFRSTELFAKFLYMSWWGNSLLSASSYWLVLFVFAFIWNKK